MKKKDSKATQIIPIILFILVGMVCGFFGGKYIAQAGSGSASLGEEIFQIAMLVVSFYAAAFIQIIVHEAGHLVFGLISGYRFMSFRIGSLMIVNSKEGMKFKRFKLMGTGGQCLMSPPELVDGKIPYVLYNLGGVVFNLVFSAVSVGVFLLTKDILILSNLFLVMAVIGICFALLNGIPLRMGAIDNDGRNALNLGKDKNATKAMWLQMKVNEMITKGVRLKDMKEEWFEMPSDEALKNPICSAIGVFACNRAMDMMDFDGMEKLAKFLEEKEAEMLPVHKNILVNDRIYCELVGENRQGIIDEFKDAEYEKFAKAMASNPSLIRTKYTYELLCKKDKVSADKQLEKFKKVSKSYPHQCEIESELELISYADKIYDERKLQS